MLLSLGAVILGLVILVWSADIFVDGASKTARFFRLPPLLIGMVIVGFGTSAPEMIVSAIASYQGNPGLALGNAYGSNITNIALILGVTALISPILIHPSARKKELPVLMGINILTFLILKDNFLSFQDAMVLAFVFAVLMGASFVAERKRQKNSQNDEEEQENGSLGKSVFKVVSGLFLLIGSSRLLVWGAVEIARTFGVSDLLIGLTILAVGTSLPELASSVMAARKGEDDIALGNVLGSNVFNTLAVVAIAGGIHPMSVDSLVLNRDVLVMTILTVFLFLVGSGFLGQKGRISRLEGGLLLGCYVAYTAYLVVVEIR